jgi:vacuolar protein sorting-associated protein 13A/C
MTEICTHFSFSILHLILRLQDDVMSFMRITSEEMTVECSEFDKIWGVPPPNCNLKSVAKGEVEA